MSADGSLLKKAGGRDVEAFERLILEYEKYIFNIAYRMLGNIEDSKDVSQETIIKIYKNIGKYKDWILY